MAGKGLQGLDETVEKTYVWLHDIAEALGRPNDLHVAYQALRAVLHGIRDLLPVDESAHLSAQLPLLVRGIYFEGWDPAHDASRDRTREGFVERIAAEGNLGAHANAGEAAHAVARVLRRHVSGGEMQDVLAAIPKHIREVLGVEIATSAHQL